MFNSFSIFVQTLLALDFCARCECRHVQQDEVAGPYKLAPKFIAEAIFGIFQYPISVQLILTPPPPLTKDPLLEIFPFFNRQCF